MIEIDNVKTYNIYYSIMGARNPMNSWERSDSILTEDGNGSLGPKDLELAQKLISGGPVHSKFMRQILVSLDLTLPLYVWKEFDTYKVGTVANSCSTMHKLATTPITRECFSFDNDLPIDDEFSLVRDQLINDCERLRKHYLETKDVRYWRALIQLLPSSWNQKRTITLNYEILRNMYIWRRGHKLLEWRLFCLWIESLPYAKELILYGLDKEE